MIDIDQNLIDVGEILNQPLTEQVRKAIRECVIKIEQLYPADVSDIDNQFAQLFKQKGTSFEEIMY